MDKKQILAEAGLTEEDIALAPWNPFDYLKTPEEINEFLTDAFLAEDPRRFPIALGHLARKKGMSEVARLAGVNRESLYRSLSSEGNPGYTTVIKVARALNIEMPFKAVAGPEDIVASKGATAGT